MQDAQVTKSLQHDKGLKCHLNDYILLVNLFGPKWIKKEEKKVRIYSAWNVFG